MVLLLLFGSVGTRHLHVPLIAVAGHVQEPRVTADLAILDEASDNVRFHVDFELFATVRTGDQRVVVHAALPPAIV
jgi:hypothetical protein